MFAASKSAKAAAVTVVTDTYFPYVSLLPEPTSTNGQQNNTFLDSSTNNFTITRNGTPTQGSVTPYWTAGQWSNYFNGSTDTLTTVSGAMSYAGDFSIECWFNTTTTTTYACLYSDETGSSGGTILLNNGANNGQITVYLTGGVSNFTSTSTGLNNGRWNHVALTRSGTSLRLFVNGALENTATVGSGTLTTVSTVRIGSSFFASRFFGGYISNFRIVVGSPVYTAAFTPSTTPLTAITNTSLLTCQSNRFIDNSSNNRTITVVGTPQVQAFQPFSPTASYTPAAYGGSGYFSGNADYLSLADNTALQLSTGDFTIEGWFYISGATSTAYNLISKGAAATGWSLNTTTGARIQFSYTASNLTGSTTTLVQNAWYHIAVVRSGSASGNLKIYLNGVQEIASAGAVTDNFNQTSTMYVSASRIATLPLNGYSSNVRVVKGTAVYTAAFTPPTAPVTAITNTSLLTNFTNAGIYDAAVQTNLITSGNAQSSTTQYKWSPTSISIDGTASTCVTFVDASSGPTDLATANGANSWTIECWIYYTAGGLVFNRGGNPGVTFSSYSLSVSGGTGTFSVSNSNGVSAGYSITYSAGSIPTSTWVYWSATRTTSGVITTYINGVSQGSSSSGINIYNINNQQFALGATATPIYGIGNILTGYIQDFRITKNVVRTITTPTAAFPTR